MKTGLIEPHYLPSLEYFCALLPFPKVILETSEFYVKQSDRNRCHVNTANGRGILAVPLEAPHGKVPFKDIRVERGARWRNNHWRTIQSAYAKAPFFEHYGPELKEVLYQDDVFLCDLSRGMLSFCLRNLGLKTEISESLVYEKEVGPEIFDLRAQITSKKPSSSRSIYQPVPYYQVFGSPFVSNLSLIDLLFCEGPNSLAILRASRM
jgi:hypothetical protein